MDVKYLYNYLQRENDFDDRIGVLSDMGHEFRASNVVDVLPCLKLFDDEDDDTILDA